MKDPKMKLLISILLSLSFILISCNDKVETSKEISFLHTEGQYIVNEQNDTILFKGVGLGNWLLPEGYMWHFGENGDRPRKIEKLIFELTDPEYSKEFWFKFRRDFITEADIKKIKDLGFNSVRPAMNARVFLTEEDSAIFIEENFQLLDNLVTWCKKYELYVILDMHGAPGGQTGANIDDSPNDLPELYMDSKYEKRLTRLWLKLVDRYKDEPVIAGYDLLNEPLPHKTGAADKYKHLAEPMYKRLTKAIRQIDKKHIVILEGVDWSNDWSIFSEPFDDNAIYQFHYYCWNNPDNLNNIDYYLKNRDKLNVPVWVGETGEKNSKIYWATTQLFETNNIGWSFWPWKKLDRTNGLCSINRPKDWYKISDYSRGKDKPSKEEAKKILDEFLENILFENCTFTTDVANALLRQIPVRVEAVNYGHYGYKKSYFVQDTSFRAKYYRTSEPVEIELTKDDKNKWTTDQNIRLKNGEWITYNIRSATSQLSDCKIKIKSDIENAELEIYVNKQRVELVVSDADWHEIIVKDLKIIKGENEFKVISKSDVKIEYFDFMKQE